MAPPSIDPAVTLDEDVCEPGSPAPAAPPPAKVRRLQFVSTVAFAFAIVALQLGQGILLARLLGPEGRGSFATAVLYAQLLLYVGLCGGLEVICRYAAQDSVEVTRLRRAALRLGMTTGIVTTLSAMCLSVIALPEGKRFLIPLALLCSLSVLGQQVMLIMTGVDRGSGEFGKYNLLRVIAAGSFPALLLMAALFVSVDVLLVCVLSVVASLVSMASCLWGLPAPFRGDSAPPVRQLLGECRPYGLSMLATDLFERLDLVLILWLVPLVEQGFYAAMVPVAYPLTVIPNTLGLFLFNAGASTESRLTTRDVHRILGSSFVVQATSTVLFMFLVGPLVMLLYGEEFESAIIFALWLAPVSAIKGILQGLDSYLKGRGRPLAPVRARIAAMAVLIVMTWLLFDRFGAVAVAMSALASQIVCLCWLSAIIYADVAESQPRRWVSE
jgi:O-antigen/teichoic acid export membrane protein